MANPININFFLCERVLIEEDKVVSAIRIVDVFFVQCDDEGNPTPDAQAVFSIFFAIKVPRDDEAKHALRIDVVFPGGQRELLLEAESVPATNVEDAPKGFTLAARVGLKAKTLGLHHLVATLDHNEIAMLPFTLSKANRSQGPEHDPPAEA